MSDKYDRMAEELWRILCRKQPCDATGRLAEFLREMAEREHAAMALLRAIFDELPGEPSAIANGYQDEYVAARRLITRWENEVKR